MSGLNEQQAYEYIIKLLTAMSKVGGSDLFISYDFPPSMKSNGEMQPMSSQRLSGEADAATGTRADERDPACRVCHGDGVQLRYFGARCVALPCQCVRAAATGRHGDSYHRR